MDDVVDFIRDFATFDQNTAYVLRAIARRKENSQIDTSISFNEIVSKTGEISRKYNKLQSLSSYEPVEGGDLAFRLYVSVNGRNVQKAYTNFKQQLAEFDSHILSGHAPTNHRVKRLDREWISELSKPDARRREYFKVDVDTQSNEVYNNVCERLRENTEIILTTETPNGYHIVTDQFNYTDVDLFERQDIEFEKDGMLFIEYL